MEGCSQCPGGAETSGVAQNLSLTLNWRNLTGPTSTKRLFVGKILPEPFNDVSPASTL